MARASVFVLSDIGFNLCQPYVLMISFFDIMESLYRRLDTYEIYLFFYNIFDYLDKTIKITGDFVVVLSLRNSFALKLKESQHVSIGHIHAICLEIIWHICKQVLITSYGYLETWHPAILYAQTQQGVRASEQDHLTSFSLRQIAVTP